MLKIFNTLLLALLSLSNSFSQINPGDEIFEQIIYADSLLFEEGFNNCNYEALSKVTAQDLEFYHDLGGITTGKASFIKSIEENICSLNYKPVRKLRTESLKLYPLKDNGKIYGVIQSGVHDFYAIEEKKKRFTSTARFNNLWLKNDGSWQLKRVLSYDHSSPEASISSSEDLFEDRTRVEAWLKEKKVPGLGLAILKNNRLVEVKTYGNLYKGVPVTTEALFNVASLTKPIISMLSLKLADNGDLDLDEPLYHYWTDPDVKDDPNHKLLTARHVLTHQTGFKNWRWESESGKLNFDFKPGTAQRYSGEGFEYLQRALERKFDKPLEDLADSLIFKPLEMNDSYLKWTEEISEEKFAKWHDPAGKNTYPTHKNRTVSAADNLITSIEDYGKFAQYILQGAGISDDLYRQMLTVQKKGQSTKMGLGWELLPELKGKEYAVLHTGGDKGVFTLIMLLPETGEGIVMFTNGDNGNKLSFKIIEEHLSLGKEITGRG